LNAGANDGFYPAILKNEDVLSSVVHMHVLVLILLKEGDMRPQDNHFKVEKDIRSLSAPGRLKK
jgi:hypothetical protein